MKKLFNDGWEFTKQPLHTTYEEIMEKQRDFQPVGLPHDWLIYQAGNLYEDSTGWYRKRFVWNRGEQELVFLRFDGIYMDSKVYVNGQMVREWKYGYSAFETEITAALADGENEILVSVDFQAPNSRWYSGAGIYRDVWIRRTPAEHLVADGCYFSAKKEREEEWSISIYTETIGEDISLEYALREKGSKDWKLLEGIRERDETGERFQSSIRNPKIWDVEHPYCYELAVTLKKGTEILQREIQTVGFQTLDFSPETGFSLNGRKLKLNGVCEHHDLGCLGAAYHSQAMRRKLEILKTMGVNAIRTAHNMPAQDLMELTDEMGILVVSESFDCWESSKNPYDYARFFPQWYQKDVESWVRRDRNHPSLIMWSIGNEIYDTHVSSEKGKEWMEKLMTEVHRHDPLKNAAVTLGSNYMPWENTQKCADVIKLIGYNYGENYYEEHHKKHPDWMIYGSLSGQALITLESQRLITPEILTLDRLTQRAFQRIPTIYIRQPGRIIKRILWYIFSLIGILMKGSLLICVFVPMRRQWKCSSMGRAREPLPLTVNMEVNLSDTGSFRIKKGKSERLPVMRMEKLWQKR